MIQLEFGNAKKLTGVLDDKTPRLEIFSTNDPPLFSSGVFALENLSFFTENQKPQMNESVPVATDFGSLEKEESTAQSDFENKPQKPSAERGKLNFTLSRFDIFIFVEKLAELKNEFSVKPKVIPRAKKRFCDKVVCGEWCFALIFERSNIIKMLVRLDKQYATELQNKFACVRPLDFKGCDDWYDIIVDFSFSDKTEVFEILKNSFSTVLNRFYEKGSEGELARNKTEAQADSLKINALAEKAAVAPDADFILAVAEREIALEHLKNLCPAGAFFSREKLVDYLKKTPSFKGNVEVIEHERQFQPTILKVNGKSFALIYEKTNYITKNLRETSLSFRVRVSDEYADLLTKSNPQISRIRFLNSRNWYAVPVNASTKNVEEAADILLNAKNFVLDNENV